MKFFTINKEGEVSEGINPDLLRERVKSENLRYASLLTYGVFNSFAEEFIPCPPLHPERMAGILVVGYGPNVYGRLMNHSHDAFFLIRDGEGFLFGETFYRYTDEELRPEENT